MKHWVFTCYICDILDNTIMKRSFLKKWEAEKWGIKQIAKHKKIDEWYYDILQESVDD